MSGTSTPGPSARPTARPNSDRLFESAAKLFFEKGYSQTSMKDVAESMDMLKGSLYYYISSKEDLLFRIVDEIHTESLRLIDEARALPEVTPLQRLHHYVAANVDLHARNVHEGAIYHREFHRLSPDRQAELGGHNVLYERFVEDLARQAQACGEIKSEVDVKTFVKYVFAVINSVFAWYRPDGPTKPEELGRAYAQLVLFGAGAAPAGQEVSP